MRVNALIEAVEQLPPPPCDDCQFSRLCRKGLSCRAFTLYTDGNRAWADAERVPSRWRYLKEAVD